MTKKKGEKNVIGYDFESFEKYRKEFELRTFSKVMDFSKTKLIHFDTEKSKKSKEFLAIQNIDDKLVTSINNNEQPEDFSAIRKTQVSEKLSKKIEDGIINNALMLDDSIFFLDKNAEKMIFEKFQISDSFNDGTKIGAILLFLLIKRINAPLTAICRIEENGEKIIYAFHHESQIFQSPLPQIQNFSKLSGFELDSWEITEYVTKILFVGEEINGFTPTVKFTASDTTKDDKFSSIFCIKTKEGDLIPLYDLKEKDFSEAEREFVSISLSLWDKPLETTKKYEKKIENILGKKRFRKIQGFKPKTALEFYEFAFSLPNMFKDDKEKIYTDLTKVCSNMFLNNKQ